MVQSDDTKTEDDKELELDSPNPKFTFQSDDKSRGLAGQQLYNEKSAVCFDTHFNAMTNTKIWVAVIIPLTTNIETKNVFLFHILSNADKIC